MQNTYWIAFLQLCVFLLYVCITERGEDAEQAETDTVLVPALVSSYDPDLLERNTLLLAGAPLPARLRDLEEKIQQQNVVKDGITGTVACCACSQ